MCETLRAPNIPPGPSGAFAGEAAPEQISRKCLTSSRLSVNELEDLLLRWTGRHREYYESEDDEHSNEMENGDDPEEHSNEIVNGDDPEAGFLGNYDPEEDNQENQDQQSEHQSDEDPPDDLFSDDTNDGD